MKPGMGIIDFIKNHAGDDPAPGSSPSYEDFMHFVEQLFEMGTKPGERIVHISVGGLAVLMDGDVDAAQLHLETYGQSLGGGWYAIMSKDIDQDA